jgi:hypothetical protein
MHYWVVWVYTEARTVLRTVVTDLFLNCSCSGILSDNRIRQVPKCLYNHAQSFILEEIQDFHVGSGSRTPQFYSIGPDWLDCCIGFENFVACGEF